MVSGEEKGINLELGLLMGSIDSMGSSFRDAIELSLPAEGIRSLGSSVLGKLSSIRNIRFVIKAWCPMFTAFSDVRFYL